MIAKNGARNLWQDICGFQYFACAESFCPSGAGTQATRGSLPLEIRADGAHVCASPPHGVAAARGSWTRRICGKFMPASPRQYSKCQPRRRQETNDDEGTNTYYCFACAGSCLGRTGAATGCAQIQPGRRSDSTDREQHAGDTRNQDLCRQPVQGRCRHRHNRGAEIAAADRGADAEQQCRSQRSGNDFGAVHSGTQRHPHRCSSAHDGAGLSDRPDAFGPTGEGGSAYQRTEQGTELGRYREGHRGKRGRTRAQSHSRHPHRLYGKDVGQAGVLDPDALPGGRRGSAAGEQSRASGSDGCLSGKAALAGREARPGEVWVANHLALFEKGIPLIQFVTNLSQIGTNKFVLIALPLKIKGGDASPARVVALVERWAQSTAPFLYGESSRACETRRSLDRAGTSIGEEPP